MSDIIEEDYSIGDEEMDSDVEERYLTTDEIIHKNRKVVRGLKNEEKKELDIPCCWSNLKNDEYAPAYVTVPKVPAGISPFSKELSIVIVVFKEFGPTTFPVAFISRAIWPNLNSSAVSFVCFRIPLTVVNYFCFVFLAWSQYDFDSVH